MLPPSIHCRSCGRRYRQLEELLRAEVWCPGCQATFDAVVSEQAPSDQGQQTAIQLQPTTGRPSGALKRDDEDRPPPQSATGNASQRVLFMVSGPGIGLMLTGGLWAAIAVLLVLNSIFAEVLRAKPGPLGKAVGEPAGELLFSSLSVLWGMIVFQGGRKLLRLESYRWAMAGAMTAVVPCSCFWLLGAPLGLWAIIILADTEVYHVFPRRRLH